MKLEIDIPEHHYNNIIALDSVSLGRVPYKGIIMYAINAIKQGKVLDQEPNIKALGEELRKVREGIKNEKVLIGFNMAVAICNKHLVGSKEAADDQSGAG